MVLGVLKYEGLIIPFQFVKANEAYDYDLERIISNVITFYDLEGHNAASLEFDNEKICKKVYNQIWYDISHDKKYFDLDKLDLKTGQWKAW